MALWDNLTHYYTLDESSGTRLDSVGSADLGGNTLAATGKSDGCAKSTSESERLGSGESVTAAGDASISCWFWHDTAGSHVLAKLFDWQIDVYQDQPRLLVFNEAVKTWSTTVTRSNWHLFVGVIDENSSLSISIDGAVFQTLTGSWTIAGSNLVDVCKAANGVSSELRVDELAIFDRLLTQSDVTSLWNGGAGEFYSAAAEPEPAIATGVVPDVDTTGITGPAIATGIIPDVSTPGYPQPLPAIATATIPDPDRVGASIPDPAVATATIPDPDLVGAVTPDPAIATAVVPQPEKVGTVPNVIRFGSVVLRPSKFSNATLIQ